MTDNEIIKAKSMLKKLEEAYDAYYDTSKVMPYDIDVTLRETAICLEKALDEINRQKAEIENLHMHIECAESKRKRMEDRFKDRLKIAFEMLKEAKAEAIKEFAERLKEFRFTGKGIDGWAVNTKAIDNLVKEMVGDV